MTVKGSEHYPEAGSTLSRSTRTSGDLVDGPTQ